MDQAEATPIAVLFTVMPYIRAQIQDTKFKGTFGNRQRRGIPRSFSRDRGFCMFGWAWILRGLAGDILSCDYSCRWTPPSDALNQWKERNAELQ